MKIDRDKTVFLLGGYDLEMVTIRDILLKAGCLVEDKRLSWGAKLSGYRDEIVKHHDKTIYAVELEVDDEELGERVEIIDHHNEYINRPASIQQILDLLELNLNDEIKRWYELVAANDSGYISAMECIGATEEEIRKIREEDKKAQGVTQEDEEIGKNDAKNKKVLDGKDIAVVKAHTDRFSAITDALYFDKKEDDKYDKTIIYSEKTINFYGFDLTLLKSIAKEFKLKNEDYYCGGGTNGYFGIKEKAVKKINIEDFKNSVIRKSSLYSSHIFMFPFRFDYTAKGLVDDKGETQFEYEFYYGNKEETINNRVDLSKLNTLLKKDFWEYEKFTISDDEKHLLYNDFAYFYDYARDVLYNHKKDFTKEAISSFYRMNPDRYSGKKYTIDILQKGCKESYKEAITYKLDIEDITLRVFQTGVAIFAIELNNYVYEERDDILRINDYGRRVYPQYIGEDGELTTKKSFLANYIQIGDDEPEYFNNFKYKDIEIGEHIKAVLGKKTFTNDKQETEKFYIQPSLDDRMYVLSWYGNSDFANDIKSYDAYKCSDDWYRYVFVDNDDATVQNNDMKEHLLRDASYARWSKYNTHFGVTRYSFVALTDSGTFGRYVVNRHMKSMYFQMATLLLANRTSILRFSDEVAALNSQDSKTIENEITLQTHREKIKKVYDIYSIYDSRLYFKEVTHQDQGVELYTKGMKQMSIYEHHDKLDSKFNRLFDYISILAGQENADAMNRLSILGAIFLPASFIMSIFGLGIFDYNKATDGFDWLVLIAIAIAVIVPIGVISFSKPVRTLMKKYVWQLLILISAIAALVVYSYVNYSHYLPKIRDENQTDKKNITLKHNRNIAVKVAKAKQDTKQKIKQSKEENNVTK